MSPPRDNPDCAHASGQRWRSSPRPPWPRRAPRRAATALLLLGFVAVLACSQPVSPRVAGGARLWFEGPVRWLMVPSEARAARNLRSNRDALIFIEEFWKKRDPTPEDRDNPFRATFFQRSAMADDLYTQGEILGSMTDQGRAFILLGSPSTLRYQHKTVPVLDPSQGAGRPHRGTARTVLEVWVYRIEDLSPEQQRQLEGEGISEEIALTFVAEGRRTYLLRGSEHLELAARAAIRSSE